jgi:Mitotic-spindle organizing gamma-tubulin ring associated
MVGVIFPACIRLPNLGHPVLFDISQLLNTKLDKETLATCVGLIESGVNPEALAVCACPMLQPLRILNVIIILQT